MPKPTQSEIGADIIDRASALFARHGFDHTALRQIADAVDYAKAGLRHHFPGKLAIYAAAIDTVRAPHAGGARQHGAHSGRIERDRALVERAVQFTDDWPGVSTIASRIAENEPDGDPQLVEIGLILYEALGIDLRKIDMDASCA